MKKINIKENEDFLKEYIELCNNEWGNKTTKEEINEYIVKKKKEIIEGNEVISIIGLIDNNTLVGFISLFKKDGEERQDLTPWYATMYVKKEYRNKGYSKVLNDLILEEATNLGYDKVYLKSNLVNYYEKFGAKYIEKLNNGENLYYISLNNR